MGLSIAIGNGVGFGGGSVPEFNPASIPGLAGRWRAQDLALANNAAVASWPDTSGNGRDLTQGTGAAQPVFLSSGGPNSKACVRFDGTDDFLRATFTLNQPCTIFWVWYNRTLGAAGAHDAIWSGVSAAIPGFYQETGANGNYLYANTVLSWLPVVATSGFAYAAAIVNSTSSRVDCNGITKVSGNTGVGNLGGITLAGSGAASSGRFGYVDFAEMIAYTGVKSDAELAQVAAYFASYYAL